MPTGTDTFPAHSGEKRDDHGRKLTGGECRTGARRLRGRVRLAGGLRPAHGGRHHISVVQNPTLSLQGDAAAARLIIDAQDGGHHRGGYRPEGGGAGLHRGARAGPRRVGEHAHRRPAARAPVPPILPPVDGFLFLDRDKFHASFAGDDPAADAAFMADSDQAELVSADHRRPDDPSSRAALVWAGRCHRDRRRRQPLRLAVSTSRGGHRHQTSRYGGRRAVVAAAGPCDYDHDQTPTNAPEELRALCYASRGATCGSSFGSNVAENR